MASLCSFLEAVASVLSHRDLEPEDTTSPLSSMIEQCLTECRHFIAYMEPIMHAKQGFLDPIQLVRIPI